MEDSWKEFDNYYKIKESYEKKIKDKLRPIIVSTLSKSDKYKRYKKLIIKK